MTLAAMLGHSHVQMVMRYAHPTEEHQFNAIKRIEAGSAAKHQPHEQASRCRVSRQPATEALCLVQASWGDEGARGRAVG